VLSSNSERNAKLRKQIFAGLIMGIARDSDTFIVTPPIV
jgi:hypothetical protein